MPHTRSVRWKGILLLLGVILFAVATIAAEPFEQESPLGLYQAIAENSTQFQFVNLLAGLGFIVLLIALVALGRLTPPHERRLAMAGLGLLGLGALLWLIEVFGRVTTTVATARQVEAGSVPPTTFPANLGVGLEPLFVAFLVTTLAGLAILLWHMGEAGLLSRRWSRVGAGVVVASGGIAALTYPWVGGIERALFYPFVLVLLPLAVSLIVRRHRT
ncbi:MAG: hypothetical protein WD906_01090 [Anaerolineales bacterium]